LTHSAVVTKLSKAGQIKIGERFTRDVTLKVDSNSDPRNLRIVAFVQDPVSGRVLAASMKLVDSKESTTAEVPHQFSK
jgi:hypothetical protein